MGGYVKLAGMIDESLDTSESNTPRENQLRYKSSLAKIWIMSAGVIMNFLLAVLIFSIMSFNYGIPEQATNETVIANIAENYYDSNGNFIKKTAAYELGLIPGDKIIKIDDVDINVWSDLTSIIQDKPDEVISVKWISNNQIKEGSVKTDTVTTIVDYKLKTIGKLGIGPEINIREIGVIESLSQGINTTKDYLNMMIFTLYALIKGELSLENLQGPVGIAKIAGDSAKAGIESLFYLIAILSINLGLINILPVPGLDGGHIFITLIESILRKEISTEIKIIIQNIGMLILLSLFIFVMFNDISKLFFN